jgi:hypothetical protein
MDLIGTFKSLQELKFSFAVNFNTFWNFMSFKANIEPITILLLKARIP